MEPSKKFDDLLKEMKDVERSEETKRNTWLALKDRIQTKRKRSLFPVFISLAIVAIASFLFLTYSIPSEIEQATAPLSNEEVIMALLEKKYNGPDRKFLRLIREWMDLQSVTETKTQEEYDQLLKSKEYMDLVEYQNTFGVYFTEATVQNLINSNMLFGYDYFLEDTDLEIHLENADIKQEKDHPNIYRSTIEVSLTNSEGQKIYQTLQEEYIFSTSELGKIGRYNSAKGGQELLEKIENFSAYVGGNEVRTPAFRNTISFNTLCFNGKIYESRSKEKNLHGCTADRKQINSILQVFDHLPIKEATEQESGERAKALPQMDNYQIYLTNAVDTGTTLYTITLYEDGVLMFAPGLDVGILGDTNTKPDVFKYEHVKQLLDEFAEN
ncbi:hypothetical protein [Bacillus sp. FJAT-22090]|uniref:hypothetical protein n=1 Tax=Bacillus sp. FJAT-22090 TaxID=1581038 RepID=UPI0011AB1AB4|nr:hypothetical protein [Bacillus sp. FJAT-22090]